MSLIVYLEDGFSQVRYEIDELTKDAFDRVRDKSLSLVVDAWFEDEYSGLTLLQKGEFDRSISSIERVLELIELATDEHSLSLTELSALYEAMGDIADVESAITKGDYGFVSGGDWEDVARYEAECMDKGWREAIEKLSGYVDWGAYYKHSDWVETGYGFIRLD